MARIAAFGVLISTLLSVLVAHSTTGSVPKALEKRMTRSSPRSEVQDITRRAGQNCTVEITVTKVLMLIPVSDQVSQYCNR